MLKKVKVSLGTSQEQKKIVTMLRLLDERIATQNKIIEDLKKLKSAIIEIEYSHKTRSVSHLGDFIEQTSKRNKGNTIQKVLSVSNRQGFIQQSEQFENRTIASDDTSNYKIVERNCFAYNPARINVGSIARLTAFEKGIVSPMYICFRTKDDLFPEYLDYYFESKQFFTEIQKRLEGSVRQCLSYEGLCNISLYIPSVEIQQRIGKQLSTLAQEIRLESDFLDLLQKQKQYLLRHMFI
jgi:type I restriction enzyme, S subunit